MLYVYMPTEADVPKLSRVHMGHERPKIYYKDRLKNLVFLSLFIMYKTVYLIRGEETQPTLCTNDAKLRSGVRDLTLNKHQLSQH